MYLSRCGLCLKRLFHVSNLEDGGEEVVESVGLQQWYQRHMAMISLIKCVLVKKLIRIILYQKKGTFTSSPSLCMYTCIYIYMYIHIYTYE